MSTGAWSIDAVATEKIKERTLKAEELVLFHHRIRTRIAKDRSVGTT